MPGKCSRQNRPRRPGGQAAGRRVSTQRDKMVRCCLHTQFFALKCRYDPALVMVGISCRWYLRGNYALDVYLNFLDFCTRINSRQRKRSRLKDPHPTRAPDGRWPREAQDTTVSIDCLQSSGDKEPARWFGGRAAARNMRNHLGPSSSSTRYIVGRRGKVYM